MKAKDKPEAETRMALLHAAGEVFASVGFRAATVREICRLAGANVAAVNYHFGDKEKLYAEVWRYSHRCALEKYPTDYGAGSGATPEDLLAAYIRSFLLRIFDTGSHAWFGKLISREMIEPTGALDQLVREEIKPQMLHLGRIIAGLLGPVPHDTVELCAISVVSQCVFYHHCFPAISRLMPHRKFAPADIALLADHITHFSVAALHGIKMSSRSRRAK